MIEQQDNNRQVVILDDEGDILELVSLHLRKAEFTPVTYDNVSDFWSGIQHVSPALIVLDLMIPGSDGYEICRQLRKHNRYAETPIVMLTARDKEVDKILGLELGADDFITKPFSPRELVARIKAILRRTASGAEQGVLSFNDVLRIDLNSYEVRVKERKVTLTATEFRLLSLLAGKKSWVFSREQILDHLWGNKKIVIDRTVDVHIKNLREKLGMAGKYIKNVRGVGYKFAC